MAEQIVIYSDGGGERSSSAAGACIVDSPEGRLQLIVFLGAATNNEAEITAGLLAFSALRALGIKNKAEVHWVCDSEYVLKSATQYINNWQRNGWKTASKKPVKNQGLWRTYLGLSKGYAVQTEHVYGHTGHDENESCDSAATWARTHAYTVLAQQEEGLFVTSVGRGDDIGWYLLDGRDFLKKLRASAETEPSEEVVQFFVDKIANLSTEGSTRVPLAKKPEESPESKLASVLEELRQAVDHLDVIADSSIDAKSLQKSLVTLLRKYE